MCLGIPGQIVEIIDADDLPAKIDIAVVPNELTEPPSQQ